MMSAVTRLPTESFLSSEDADADGHELGGSMSMSSHIISPLRLGPPGYFDLLARSQPVSEATESRRRDPVPPKRRTAQASSLPRSEPSYFLSPRIAAATRDWQQQQQQQRSSSLSPTRLGKANFDGKRRARFTMRAPPQKQSRGSGASRKLSETFEQFMRTSTKDLLHSPLGNLEAAEEIISRLGEQKVRMREAWEAERAILETIGAQGEQANMTATAMSFEQGAFLDVQRQSLMHENNELRMQLAKVRKQLQEAQDRLQQLQPSTTSGKEAAVKSVGDEACDQEYAAPTHASGSMTGIPGPWTKPLSPPNFIGDDTDPAADKGRYPIVDIQEIDSKLEGIPLKATAIQKPTFTNRGAPLQQSPSPALSGKKYATPRHGSLRDQAKQLLAAPESSRLLMNAGHTPSHSLSLLPTSTASAVSTTPSSGNYTPKWQVLIAPHASATMTTEDSGAKGQVSPSLQVPRTDGEHVNERALREPLMVRNMPAHDEVFFRRLSDKLEHLTRDPASSVPAVLREHVLETSTQFIQAGSVHVGVEGRSEGSAPPGIDDETEIPLRLRRATNFGAPFGEMR